MSQQFGRGCGVVPNAIELRNYLISRLPNSFGIYYPSTKTTEIYTRSPSAVLGYSLTSYTSDDTTKHNKIDKRSLGVVNIEQIIAAYQDAWETERVFTGGNGPLPDIVTQYSIYRARTCTGVGTIYTSYPGDLVMYFHTNILNSLTTPENKQNYLAAFLAIPPDELFIDTSASTTEKVFKLLEALDSSLKFLLSKDLDPRVDF